MDKSPFCFRFRNGSLNEKNGTQIMGIINITPDSFSDGGKNFKPYDAIKTASKMKMDGVKIVDLGAQSTRPGYTIVSEYEEWKRLEPIISEIIKTGLYVSVDTFYPSVAERALDMGCHIINDVSGKVSADMAMVIKKYNAGWIIMHSDSEKDNRDIISDVHLFFEDTIKKTKELGIDKEFICFDPGIGFGKSYIQNLTLIANTDRVKINGICYLMAASRKRVIGEADGTNTIPQNRDSGTVAAHTAALLYGADILRVHNTDFACQATRVADKILQQRK